MHLHNINKHRISLSIVLLLMTIGLTTAIASPNEVNNADFSKVFSNLMKSATEENKELLSGWDEYLIKVVGHSNADHLMVIEEFSKNYAKALKAIDEKCMKYDEQDKKNYTHKWLDDVAKHFSKEFVCNNNSIVMMNLLMAFRRTDTKRYDQDVKEIISKELNLFLAYESYLNHFIDYYNKLSKKDQDKINAWIAVAEKYLSITNRSHFATIHLDGNLNRKMDENAMQKNNYELYMYFKKLILPFSSGAFRKARNDMKLFIDKCEGQGLIQPE